MYGIYANIGGILMVNVTIYTIHGSYGKESKNPFGYPEFLEQPIWPIHQNMPKSVVPEGPHVLQICRWKGTRSPWSRWTFWCATAAFFMHNCRWKRLFLDKTKRRCEVGELLSCYCFCNQSQRRSALHSLTMAVLLQHILFVIPFSWDPPHPTLPIQGSVYAWLGMT